MPFPFEVTFTEVEANLDGFVDEVFGALQSEFLNLPKGDGFVDYQTFSKGYEELRSEEHTSELQSRSDLVCRLLLEKKKRQRCSTALKCCRYSSTDGRHA